MAKFIVVADGGFKSNAWNTVQYAAVLWIQKEVQFEPIRLEVNPVVFSFSKEYEKPLRQLGADIAELEGILAGIAEAAKYVKMHGGISSVHIFTDSENALRYLEDAEDGSLELDSGSYEAEMVLKELAFSIIEEKKKIVGEPSVIPVVRPTVSFHKVTAHALPDNWVGGVSGVDMNLVYTFHNSCDSQIHAARKAFFNEKQRIWR